jgi:hypothetical protein
MEIDDRNIKGYLAELYRQTGGDLEARVSMYEVGASIGLDRTEAGSLAEQLMVQGQAELRTLAGEISITAEGLTLLGIAAPSPHSTASSLYLGKGPVADENDRRTIHTLTEEIKKEISSRTLEYELLEEIVLDLKTMEVHLLSPHPKVGVVREIFRSLQETLAAADLDKVAALLKDIIV